MMNLATVSALQRINREFYSRESSRFSDTREQPWPGWSRVLNLFLQDHAVDLTGRRPSILDVGCGNGRFALYLRENLPAGFTYTGIDSSAELLSIAAERLADLTPGGRLLPVDVVSDGLGDLPQGETFDLIVAFGLMHHVPGQDQRRRLLERLAERVSEGGALVVTFWQFGGEERFLRRVVPWEEFNKQAVEPIDPRELEPGDLLLGWGNDVEGREASLGIGPVRYCHFADPTTAGQLIASLPLEEIESFRSDGRSGELNLYFVLG